MSEFTLSSSRSLPRPGLPLLLAAVAALLLLFAVAFDQGTITSLLAAGADDSTIHEFFHDARHTLGFPCH